MDGSIPPVTGAAGQDPNAVYPLGSSLGESARLQRQAEELAADKSRWSYRPVQSCPNNPWYRCRVRFRTDLDGGGHRRC